MKITLTNDFHNTETNVITKDGSLSRWQVKRAKKNLCPSDDCYCSGSLGQRGMDINVFVYQDGSAKIYFKNKVSKKCKLA